MDARGNATAALATLIAPWRARPRAAMFDVTLASMQKKTNKKQTGTLATQKSLD